MNMEISSPTIGAISEALSKAQSQMGNALKDSANPFFKSKYADCGFGNRCSEKTFNRQN